MPNGCYCIVNANMMPGRGRQPCMLVKSNVGQADGIPRILQANRSYMQNIARCCSNADPHIISETDFGENTRTPSYLTIFKRDCSLLLKHRYFSPAKGLSDDGFFFKTCCKHGWPYLRFYGTHVWRRCRLVSRRYLAFVPLLIPGSEVQSRLC